MNMRIKTIGFILLICAMGSMETLAQSADPSAVLPAIPELTEELSEPAIEAEPSTGKLGEWFESKAAGIAFRAPGGLKLVKRASSDQIAHYVDEKRNWVIKVKRSSLGRPLSLTGDNDDPDINQKGLLELTVDQLLTDIPAAEVLRQDVISLSDADVGMIALRYTLGTQRKLTQQALIQANDQLYYIFDLTSPGKNNPAEDQVEVDADAEDPRELEAVEAFRKMIESVRILDRGSVKDEQNHRLYRTRALFVAMNEKKLRSVLIDEQWLRILRNGKDMGYTYVIEETKPGAGIEEISIGVRSRTYPEKNVQVDAESWLSMSLDRRHESWSSVAVIDEGKPKKDYISEFGASDRKTKPVANNALGSEGVSFVEEYDLSVTHLAKSASSEPVQRELPPFYIPQAMGYLLPRLLPLNDPKNYLFATYVSDQREVMLRYIDVGVEQKVSLAGKSFEAIPIKDRIGYEGPITTHYMSLDGKYLGSENKDSKIVLLPSDADSIKKIWQNADLTRPGKIERPTEENETK